VTVDPPPASPGRTGRWRGRLARGLAWSAAGVALGLAGTWLTLKSARATFGQAAGPWRVSLLAGSPDADLLTRARVAVGGLLALDRRETLYYVAAHDSAGRALRSRCSWRISGRPPPARWWSLTAYADDHFLFEDAARRYSVNSATAVLDAEGRFSVVTGPSAPAGHTGAWLPTPGDRGLVLTLRAYNPGPALVRDPASLETPRIEPLGDCP
jgi:hypothetical protein